MASKFDIEIETAPADPDSPVHASLVKVIDHDQDEDTGFQLVELPRGDLTPSHILAHAYRQHECIAEMLDAAVSVAYAVYLNEDDFDVHGFVPSIDALISQSCLQGGTEPAHPSGNRLPPTRM